MKRLFPFLFLFAMVANEVFPALERLERGFFCEMNDGSADENDENPEPKNEESKEGKDAGKEKAQPVLDAFPAARAPYFLNKKPTKKASATDEWFVTEWFASMPERPPEA